MEQKKRKKLEYTICNADDSATVYLYDAIGSTPWSDGVMPRDVADALAQFKGLATVHVRINSPGGNFYDGMTIYHLLNTAQQTVQVHVDGLAASAASFIAMAGDDIEMADGAQMMIHCAMGGQFGFADDLRKEADLLDKVSKDIANIYSERTGQPFDKIMDMMTEETWMQADECEEMGFANKVVPAKKIAACSFDLSKWNFKHPPKPAEKSKRELLGERLAALRGHCDKARLVRQQQ